MVERLIYHRSAVIYDPKRDSQKPVSAAQNGIAVSPAIHFPDGPPEGTLIKVRILKNAPGGSLSMEVIFPDGRTAGFQIEHKN